jgi:hypothetical protein
MLSELVDHVIGVDPDRDWITLAVLEAHTAGVVAEGRFAATGDGYEEAIVFVDGHSIETERAWVIEGSAGYGRGLTVALAHRGEWVIEFDRPTRKTKDGAKSDALDAIRAAREMLGRKRLSMWPRAALHRVVGRSLRPRRVVHQLHVPGGRSTVHSSRYGEHVRAQSDELSATNDVVSRPAPRRCGRTRSRRRLAETVVLISSTLRT